MVSRRWTDDCHLTKQQLKPASPPPSAALHPFNSRQYHPMQPSCSHRRPLPFLGRPHRGYAKFRALDLDRDWLPTWLQKAGYKTLYTGKFIVDYTIRNYDPPPSGWTVFDALVHPFIFEYYSPAFSLNGGQPRMYPGGWSG
ncbi:hypothetical protein VaNZ11_000003, partial [Volvox africanus]